MDDRTQEFNKPPEKKPFQLDISFDDGGDPFEDAHALLDEAMRKPKGEVYFANQPRTTYAPVPVKRPKRRKKFGFSAAAILLLASLVASIVISFIGITALRDIFAIGKDPADLREVDVVIAADLSTDEIIDILADNGLIRLRRISRLYARFTYWLTTQNFENPVPPVYLAGTHSVRMSWGLEEMLESMREQRRSAETVVVAFPEHFTVRQVFERLADNRVTSVQSLNNAMRGGDFDYHFIRAFEDIDPADLAARFFLFEGYLFPDTYEFYVGESANSVLCRFFDNFNRRWTEDYAERAQELGMSVDEVIILASIIQMEAANQEQMGYVSSVLHNRLNNPSVFPLLQCDATRDYVMRHIAPELEGPVTFYNEMFNTYVRPGLPAGPINNPGVAAIEAALWPYDTDYYFFQHDRYRRIYMSRTVQEHGRITMDLVTQGINQ